jgi:casein kinase II subunit beta
MSDYEEEDEKWIQWFCNLPGNDHFCEVAQSYIEDSFNLYGLRAIIPNYQDALNIILDMTGNIVDVIVMFRFFLHCKSFRYTVR